MNSMTGYGRGNATEAGNSVTIEISAVNHKQRDLRINLPAELHALEAMLKPKLDRMIIRGAVTFTLTYELAPEQRLAQIQLDHALASHLLHQLRQLADSSGLAADRICVSDILTVPGVVISKPGILPLEELSALAVNATDQALAAFQIRRATEGQVLIDDLHQRCQTMIQLTDQIDAGKDAAVQHYRQRLHERINQLGIELSFDDDRLVKEVAFVAQKADISEELTRLKSHLQQFSECLTATDIAIGRTLTFLAQELQREINTLGAKTCDSTIANYGLSLKAELDRVKEQLCNIE